MSGQATASASGKKRRLGKGLGALLGEYLPEENASTGGFRKIATATIAANPFQPRHHFDAEELAELAASIQENGLLQPIVVRPAGPASLEGHDWELVAGERRLRAVRKLGWSEVPAIVREMDNETLLVLAIVENVQREGLSPLEEAEGYRQLIDEFGYTQKDVAESVGKERSTVANLLRLLQLPASVQRFVSAGTVSMGHARAILGLGDERSMADVARRVASEGLSVRAVEKLVRQRRDSSSRESNGTPSRIDDSSTPHLRRLETELQRVLGTAVRIHQTGGDDRGKIEIPFYGNDDFERVLELLLGEEALKT